MKRSFLMLISVMMSVAAVPAGYDQWSAEQFAAHEEALHKSMKNGLPGRLWATGETTLC
jgi:hypothetical protein